MKYLKRKQIEKLILIAIFAIAMGHLEATVVCYLRLLPAVQGSLNLPAVPNFPREILFAEQLRESATIVMLVSLAMLVGKNNWQKVFVFIFAFSIWDLIYYASLRSLANWPTSLFDLDVVFLIPIQWTFPIYFPVILFTFLTFLSGYKILKEEGNNELKPTH